MEFDDVIANVAMSYGVPKEEVLSEIENAIEKIFALKSAENLAELKRLGFDPEVPPTPEEFIARLALDIKREDKLIEFPK